MTTPDSFHSVLEKLVNELTLAHDGEVAALRAQIGQSSTAQALHFQPKFGNARKTPVAFSALEHAPSTPTQDSARRQDATSGSASFAHDYLPTTPRQQSMSHTSDQPPQPKLAVQLMDWDCPSTSHSSGGPSPPKLPATLMDWDSEQCAADDDVQPRPSVAPGRFTAVGNLTDVMESRLPLRASQSWDQGFLSSLPDDYVEHLETMFDHLDIEETGKISLGQCVQLVQSFSDVPLDAQNLVDSLVRVRADRSSLGLSGGESQANFGIDGHVEEDEAEDYWITFEDFAYLMACGDFDTEARQSQNEKHHHLDVVAALRTALSAYDSQQRSLAVRAEMQRQEHERLVILLDLIPAPVIILNALVMGLRADISPDGNVWEILDVGFLVFYICEAIIKWYVFRCTVYWCGPGKTWNWFDVACITISVADMFLSYVVPLISPGQDVNVLGEFMLVKTLRLVRLARLVKVLNYPMFKELKAMIFGVVAGVRVILWAIVLLFVCVFFLGAIMNNLIGDERAEFTSVPASMFTVFRCFTDGCTAYDGTPLQEHLRSQYGAPFVIGYTLAFMFITVGVFNLIMASFIENVVSTTQARKQEELCHKLDTARISLEIMVMRLICDTKVKKHRLISEPLQKDIEKQLKHDVDAAFRMLPHDLSVSKAIFRQWLQDKEFIHVLQEADIETSNTSYLFDILDADMSGELSLKELIDGLMRLRGPITKADMIGVRMQLRVVMLKVTEVEDDLHQTGVKVDAEVAESKESKPGAKKKLERSHTRASNKSEGAGGKKTFHRSWMSEEFKDELGNNTARERSVHLL